MVVQLSTAVRNARLDAIEVTIGNAASLKVLTGTMPANTAAADTGTVVATIALPADWMQNASGGSKAMSGTWQDSSADASGTAGYFRIYDSGAVCHFQGTVSATGGGGDMTVDNVVFASGQNFQITSFVLTDGNN